MVQLNDLGEDALVARLVSQLPMGAEVLVGTGDDCAVVRVPGAEELQLLKTDCIVESVHFLSSTEPERVGWKAVARVLSDFASMGGAPRHLLATLVVSNECLVEWVDGLYAGMTNCGACFGATIVGGETSRMPEGGPAVISVSATGRVREGKFITRSRGRPGDVLFVTGFLGGSLSGKHLDFMPRLQEGRWLAEQGGVRAMMDLSDGLAMDLPRLARASGCGYELHEKCLPLNEGVEVSGALSDGEDYELLLAVDPERERDITNLWSHQFPQLPLSRVGELTEERSQELSGGWDHFGGERNT